MPRPSSTLRPLSLSARPPLHPILWSFLFGLILVGLAYSYLSSPISAVSEIPAEPYLSSLAVTPPDASRSPSHFLALAFPSSTSFRSHDIDLLARTIYGEARGEASDRAREAVAHVILNRMRDRYGRWPKTVEAVVRQKNQFSCWNNNDPNYELIKNVTFKDPDFRKAYQIALKAIRSDDSIKGANHFHTIHVNPQWAQDPHSMRRVAKINQHIFYKR